MLIQPYLFLDGRCEEAIEFYRKTLAARVVMMMRFKENPEASAKDCGTAPGTENKIMHANLQIGETQVLMSDGRCAGQPKFDGFALSLTVPDAATADRLFAALLDGGQVQMPLTTTFFSPRFGMLADKFGVSWMIYVKPS